jgi:hypothetical protein
MRPITGRRSDAGRNSLRESRQPNWDSNTVLTLMAKSCHGFKAASQQNRFRAGFFLRHHRSAAGSGGGCACIAFVSLPVARRAIAGNHGAAIILFRRRRGGAARGHA